MVHAEAGILGPDLDARYGAALCLAHLGRLDELSEAAEALVASGVGPVRERAADLHGLLGRGLAEKGQWARAAEAFEHASRLAASPEAAARMPISFVPA